MQSPLSMEVEEYDIIFLPCLPKIAFGPTFNTLIKGAYKVVKHTGTLLNKRFL